MSFKCKPLFERQIESLEKIVVVKSFTLILWSDKHRDIVKQETVEFQNHTCPWDTAD